MSGSLSDALIEAYACAPSDVVPLETISISHPALPETLYFVQNNEPITAYLETGVAVTFQPCGFRMALPSSGKNGIQNLTISIDNVDRQASDFVRMVKGSAVPVTITYRPYLSNDLSAPHMNPPLRLTLRGASISLFEVTGQASFADLVNRPAPNEIYTRKRFPGLSR